VGRLSKPRAHVKIALRRRPSEDGLLDVALFGGLLMFALGFGWIYPPLFLIVGGACLVAIQHQIAKLPLAANPELERARRLEAGEE
jgi:hypothetical protein